MPAPSAAMPVTLAEATRLIDELRRHQAALTAEVAALQASSAAARWQRSLDRELFELAPVGYVTLDATGIITEANQEAARLMGCARARLIGRPLCDLARARERAACRRFVDGLLDVGERREYEATFDAEDGVARAVHCIAQPTPDGLGVLAALMDVSARRRAEADLALRDRAMTAVEQGLVITDVRDPVQPLVYVNPGFERLTGYRSAEILGRNCRFLQGKDSDPDAVAVMRSAIASGSPCIVEVLNYRKDGSPFWNAVHLTPIRDEDGTMTHVAGVQVDITARRQLARILEQSQRMETVGQLAGGVAHDFNNLLTVIEGYSSVVADGLTLDHPMREFVLEIGQAGRRAADLTRQLLLFSRRQPVALVAVDVNEVITDTTKLLAGLLGERITLTTDLAPGLDRTMVDVGQLQQVLMNLAINAREAMPQGGALTIRTAPAVIESTVLGALRDAPGGGFLAIMLTDTGVGISDAARAHIFEPYFTTKAAGEGAGLGLTTAYGIIAGWHGFIDVESAPGQGATFTIYLPIRSAGRAAGLLDASAARPPGGGETVLVVENEPAVRSLVRRVLSARGYGVLEAGSADGALALLRARNPPVDLLLTDVVMPGRSGRELADEARVQQPGIRVLFMSGHTEAELHGHGIEVAEVAFLAKPFTAEALAGRVAELLHPAPSPGEAARA